MRGFYCSVCCKVPCPTARPAVHKRRERREKGGEEEPFAMSDDEREVRLPPTQPITFGSLEERARHEAEVIRNHALFVFPSLGRP